MLQSYAGAGIRLACLVVGCAGVAGAEDFPNRPIRIVTSSAGGGSDATTRLIAQGIAGALSQPIIVENRPTGIIPGEIVSRAIPDGYTLFITGSNFWIGPLLRKAPYDPVQDFSPITLISMEVNVVAVHPSTPAKSIRELIALAKGKPGELNYASSSIGGPSHLAAELFKAMAGINIGHIPYKGGGPQVTALIGGEVQVAIADLGLIMPHVKSGRLRDLAVTSSLPSALAPGLPTVAAAGLAGYESVSMTGMFAPAKTPGAVINRLNGEVARFLGRAEVKEKFLNARGEVVGNSPAQFAAIVKTDIAKMGKVIRDANIKVD